MRLLQMLEKKSKELRIVYHGTSSVFLRQILKHGLLANPPERTYDHTKMDFEGLSSDIASSQNTMEDAVYLTPNKRFAETIAQSSITRFGGKPMLIKVQYVQGSGYVDEDEITHLIIDNTLKLIPYIFAKNNIETEEPIRFLRDNESLKPLMIDILSKTIIKIIDEKVGVLNTAIQNNVSNLISLIIDESDPLPIGKIANRLNNVMVLSDLKKNPLFNESLKRIVRNISKMKNINVSVPRDIKFKGKTRIIGIQIEGKKPSYGKEVW